MATWTITAQLTTGTLTVGATDRIWLNGSNFGDSVTVGSYQDSTHISDNADAHQCTSNHVHNTKYLTGTTVSVDGGGSANLNTVTTGNCPLKINFSDASSVATSNGLFYAYDGTTDATPMSGVTFQAFEQGDSSWTAANGSGAAVSLTDQSAATSHDFYVGLSVSPSSTGAKTGKVKASLTYV